MKFTLQFKTPDVTSQIPLDMNLDFEERHVKFEEACELANEFILYDEFITIEFDTELKTATVKKIIL